MTDSTTHFTPKELFITAVVFVVIGFIVWFLFTIDDRSDERSLKNSGHEVVGTVIDKYKNSGGRRNPGFTVRIYYSYSLNGKDEETMVQSGDITEYVTTEIGDTEVLCVDPSNPENSQSEFEECAVKLTPEHAE